MYVWNQWVFRHEVVQEGHLPYFTDRIFALTEPANLSLHNYTAFQNLLALPLIGVLGVIASFNVVFLLMRVLTAYATFLLARHVTGHVAESWLAGALFAWSPLLIARGTEHFSLVAAAPLAIFLLVLLKADGHERFRDAVALGVTEWLAASTDVYYAVYCLLIGAIFLAARIVAIHRSPQAGRSVAIRWALDVLILSMVGFIAALAISGGWELSVMGRPVPIHSLYTPMMVLTMLVTIRVAWELRTSLLPASGLWRLVRFSLAAGVVAICLLSPVLYATAVRLKNGPFDPSRIFWRSSPGGVDVLALFLPNPNHPLAPAMFVDWLNSWPTRYIEGLVSVPLVAIATLCRRVARRMGAVAMVGRPHRTLWSAGSRTVHSHRRRQHVRAGSVGVPALRADSRAHSIAVAIQRGADAGRGDPVRDGTGCTHAPISGETAAHCLHRRCPAALRAVAGAAADLFGGDAAHLSAREGRARATSGSSSFRSVRATARAASATSRLDRSSTRRSTRRRWSAAICRACRSGASACCAATR